MPDVPLRIARERLAAMHAVDTFVASGATLAEFAVFAECVACGASVTEWQEHLRDRATRRSAKGAGAAVTLHYAGACSVCGSSVVKLGAERRRDGAASR